MKHLLKMSDLTPDEVAHILDVADELKAQQKAEAPNLCSRARASR